MMQNLTPILLEPKKQRILLLDDEPAVVHSWGRVIRQFHKDWETEMLTDPEEAWFRLQRESFDVVVTDVRMPKVTGLMLLERMQLDPQTARVPVVIVTGQGDHEMKLRALELGAVDLLEKPVEPRHLVVRLQQVLRWKEGQDILAAFNARLRRMLDRHLREVTFLRLGAIRRLLVALQQRNSEVAQHSMRVAFYARILAQLAGLEEAKCSDIFWAGMVHDIGKMVLPDSLLARCGEFSPGETLLWQKHCQFGAQILQGQSAWESSSISDEESILNKRSLVEIAAQVALAHHEWWDGSGFPHGWSGEAIPLCARLVTLANAIDHDTWSIVRAHPLGLLVSPFSSEAARAFDPRLLKLVRDHEQIFRSLSEHLRRATGNEAGGLTAVEKALPICESVLSQIVTGGSHVTQGTE